MENGTTVTEFVAAIKRCTNTRDLVRGRNLYQEAVASNLHINKYVASALITMYSKFSNINFAHKVFNEAAHRDVVTWNSLILGYVQNGKSLTALDILTKMDCRPSSVTFVAGLKACGGLVAEENFLKEFVVEKMIVLHKRLKNCGFQTDVLVATTLLDVYSKCGRMCHAKAVFEGMITRSVVSWNSLIQGYVQNGLWFVAMDLFTCMDCEPDEFTYAAVLKAYGDLADELEIKKEFCLEEGMKVHKEILACQLGPDVVMTNTLIHLYTKCGLIELARKVFDGMTHRSVVSWTSLISGYVENEEYVVAMELFHRIDCKPDSLTFVAVLKACGGLSKTPEKKHWLESGIWIQRRLTDLRLDDDGVVANALVAMFCKFGCMQRAKNVFFRMKRRTPASWNSLVNGYVENDEFTLALDVFYAMDCQLDSFTYVAALKACGGLASLSAGERVHAAVCLHGLEQDQMVANTLIDFYVRCGCPSRAELVFNTMYSWNVVSWNTMIAGFSAGGELSQVCRLTREMEEAGHPMVAITFTSILTAYSHRGMVNEAKRLFDSSEKFGISKSMEHCNCMVDVLGRANKLFEALALIKALQVQTNATTWMTLLGASRRWKNDEVGKVAFDKLVERNIL